MSAAIQATTAEARAGIASRLLKATKPHNLGRNFDDCFEMGDGSEVKRLLIERASEDADLLDAMKRHSYTVGTWVEEAETLKRQRAFPSGPWHPRAKRAPMLDRAERRAAPREPDTQTTLFEG